MTGTRTGQAPRRRAVPTGNVSSLERRYPGADANTAQFVNRLKNREAINPQTRRQTSRALIENAYKGAPQAGQTPRQFDNNYSPYSNVNAEAAANTLKRQEEARRRAEVKRTQERRGSAMMQKRQGRPMPAAQQTPRAAANIKKEHAMEKRAPKHDRAQTADSGPREVAIKHVPFPKVAFLLVFIFIVMFLMVHSIVNNFEQQRKISELQKQVEVLSQSADQLRSELEARDDYAEIEERAEELGMIKGGQTDEKYIDLSGGDVIENFGDDGEDLGSFSTMLSAIRRQLSRFLG